MNKFLIFITTFLFLFSAVVVNVNAEEGTKKQTRYKGKQVTQKVEKVSDSEKKEKGSEEGKKGSGLGIDDEILDEKEIKKIRESAYRQREAIEKEDIKDGIIRTLYIDMNNVYKIKTSVGYSTSLCFSDDFDMTEFEASDIVLGSDVFNTVLYGKKKCIILFPKKTFKNTNLTVFIKKEPYHFILEEVFTSNQIDYRVDIRKIPKELPPIEAILRAVIYEDDGELNKKYGTKFVMPSVSNKVSKEVKTIFELKYPKQMRIFKIKDKEKKIKADDVHMKVYDDKDGYLYLIVQNTNKVKVSYEGGEYEIY